jgi:hypothetical protein
MFILCAFYLLFHIIFKLKPDGLLVTIGRIGMVLWLCGNGVWFFLIYFEIFENIVTSFLLIVQLIFIISIILGLINKYKSK